MTIARVPVQPFAVHGGRLDRARALLPEVAEWTDLSTGIAPWPYPVRIDAGCMTALPDPADLSRLETVAARVFGTSPDRVAAVPGTDIALRLIGTVLDGPAAYRAPGYSGHRAMWPAGQAASFGGPDLGDLNDLSGRDGHVILARPNNPDGWIADRAALLALAERLAARGRVLIVDEAFADAEPDDSLAGHDVPGLIVLRSFGKFFGLAGLRLGCVIAAPKMLARVRALLGDWPVAAPALVAGLAAYADAAWQAAQRARLINGSQRMADLIAGHGLIIRGRTPYFTLIESGDRDALFDHLIRAGILTRPFADQPHWLRIGLPGKEADWTRLQRALTQWRTA
ncbi:aminotransferase class I/II-fold pyridoxal phosphate-dependent enzyme [Sphingomonas sp. BGYR3]|uniref:aminotransferase class I/II-fold pyridoxal phosphate-dependent enzyme n=1 Tax=Sphingomonas sp. BGYR3 TaxID=2975483 RepID=UPI0021A39AD8|nr:aminotransferase class I/II-fold pyridoxal phosphate-dependent enzyme [Sphingomonas sp. BGYR3]MDG5489848.1 aminotransferase class I/II-fold pyridoxal phosphate-dependent enzyme [Sphingomonas sp. BGYR3]